MLSLTLATVAAMTGLAAATAPSCASNSPLSCSVSKPSNTCCTEVQGQVLQVQFWDTDPSTGPSNSWTIHGLWPDNCDGTYESNCDSSRYSTDIAGALQSGGASSTLSYMQQYWLDQGGDDESFWEHEWDKHGTCFSTLNPSCYSGYQKNEELVDFFEQTVKIFKSRPTYTWLAAAGITPSSTKTYTKAAVQAALKANHGATVTLDCESGALYQISYGFNVRGSVASGSFVATTPSSAGSCGTSFKYLPK